MSVQTCVLSGTVADGTGTAVKNALVRVRLSGMGVSPSPVLVGYPFVRPLDVVVSGGVTVSAVAQMVYTDAAGAWSVTLPQEAAFVIEIPAADVYHYGRVPAAATALLTDLLPGMQRWHG